MKRWAKKWWVWLVVVLVVGGIGAGGKDKEQPAPPPVQAAAKAIPAKTTASDPEAWKATAAEFARIENGMTLREVVDIIGMLGKMLSEAGEKGTEAHAVVYQFEGVDGGNVVVEFQGGKVIAKAQHGLIK